MVYHKEDNASFFVETSAIYVEIPAFFSIYCR